MSPEEAVRLARGSLREILDAGNAALGVVGAEHGVEFPPGASWEMKCDLLEVIGVDVNKALNKAFLMPE